MFLDAAEFHPRLCCVRLPKSCDGHLMIWQSHDVYSSIPSSRNSWQIPMTSPPQGPCRCEVISACFIQLLHCRRVIRPGGSSFPFLSGFRLWTIELPSSWQGFWLVVSTPLKNISQLGWSFPIYGKISFMFQTTNQVFVPSVALWSNRPFLPQFTSVSSFIQLIPSDNFGMVCD